MSEPKRICAFYSHGPHYRRLLRFLRERHPEAHITAMVPPSYPRDILDGEADEVAVTAQAAYSSRDLAAVRQLLRLIRNGGYDRFVYMFDSPRLRILAALTGVGQRYCYQADGRYAPASLSLAGAAAVSLWRGIRGRLTYARIWLNIRFRHVERGSR